MSKKFSVLPAIWVLTLLVLSLGTPASAQFRSSIQGVVTDPKGMVIPDATLTLKDLQTNITVVRKTSSEGVFNFNTLPPDHFSLTVEKTGFQKKVLDNLQLIPEQANSVNVKLDVGNVSETVTVNLSAEPSIDTETPNIGGTISSNDIDHMPATNRDVFTLTQLVPGLISDNAQNGGGGVLGYPGNEGPGGTGSGGGAPTENGIQANSNGQQHDTNSVTVDGISTISAVWGGATFITPDPDSIQNVRIVTSDYDAEYGRFSGAHTMVTTKSGTNNFHGSLFWTLHRPGLNAYQRSTGVGQPQKDTADFNQYGGSIGGPIWKNKIFAFFDIARSPQSSMNQGSGWYDTAAFDAMARSGSIASTYLTFPGHSISSSNIITNGETCANVGLEEGVTCNTIAGQGLNIGSPLTTSLGTQDPTATGTSVNPGVGSGLSNVADIADYATVTPSTALYTQYNGRLDANVTSKDHVAFAIYWVPSQYNIYYGGARPYNQLNHTQINDAFSLIWDHVISPTFVNEARVSAGGWRWNEIKDNPTQPIGLPSDSINGLGSISINQFGTNLGSIFDQWTFGYNDVATKTAGRHTIKFGVDVTHLRYLNQIIGRPSYGFYNIWDFLNDAPSSESGNFDSQTGYPSNARYDNRANLFGFFVQDNWRIKPNLTITAGLRYSLFPQLYDRENNLNVAKYGAGSSLLTGLTIVKNAIRWPTQKSNFGPQLGFNWSPKQFHERLVLRGGYGLIFNQQEVAVSANVDNNPPGTSNYNFAYSSPSNPGTNGANIVYGISSSPTSLSGYASNPHAITTYNSANLPTGGNAQVTIFGDANGNVPTQYDEHYSLDADYDLGHHYVASVGYSGSRSHNLITQQQGNAEAAVTGIALNPLITNVDHYLYNGYGNNNELLAEVKHTFSHQFSANAQFFWAKAFDTGSNVYQGSYSQDAYYAMNRRFSYGRSDYNIGKSFKVFGLWQPVIFHGSHGWMEKVAGGWSLSGIMTFHTGFPFTANYYTSQSLYCSICSISTIRPYILGGYGKSHSNKAFETGSNFAGLTNEAVSQTATVNGSANTVVAYSNKYFAIPNIESAMTGSYPSVNEALPPPPGSARNTFDGPGYRDVDASLTKAFGLPSNRVLGEGAKLEIRADFSNLFNLLNLYSGGISNNVTSSNFGQDTSALGARVISFQTRFSF